MGITCIISNGSGVTQSAPGTIVMAPETIFEYMEKDSGQQSISFHNFINHPDWNILSSLAGYSILMGVIVVAVLVATWLGLSRTSSRFRDWSLKRAFFAVWLYGFIVYDVGMCTGQYISLLTNAPMAIVYAFKIFLFDSDVSEIHQQFHESWVYSFNFALVHFLAAIISTLFLIKYFGFNIVAWMRIKWACIRSKKSETFVFWGFNESSIHLIESIQQKYAESRDYRIVIVRTNKADNESLAERTGFARIFDFLAMPTSELERLQTLGCLTAGSYTNLKSVNIENGESDILGSVLKLRLLKKLLHKKTGCKIHMFFLSDDDTENLHDVSIMLHDSTIQAFGQTKPEGPEEQITDENGKTTQTENKKEVLLYCLARYNSIHRVIEDQNIFDTIKVKVVDSSHINVEMLKQNEELLPVNFVDVQDNGTVSSKFNALVVGFSEVGEDSVRFLYEFGAFVKTGSTVHHVERSEFHLDVVDKNMDDLAGTFVANVPAIHPAMPFIKDKHNDKDNKDDKNDKEDKDAAITLHKMDCRSAEFYIALKDKWIQELNYVVIATENDELNLSLGVRIFKLATRYRENLDNVCILVRTHNDDDGNIRKIADHYNRLWAAQQAVKDFHGKEFVQTTVKVDKTVNGPIHIFGLDKDTFTYENIVDDSLEQQAINYKERYEASSNPEYKKPKHERDKAWYTDFRNMMQLTEDTIGYYPSLCGLQSLRRKQGQDLANCLHTQTKKLLAEKALHQAGIPDFDWTILTRKFENIVYELPSGQILNPQIIKILNVLAQTEHLRWNASHELLGYIQKGTPDDRDEIKLHHSCLTSWENLPPKTQSYDYNVVDVTLNILNPNKPINI